MEPVRAKQLFFGVIAAILIGTLGYLWVPFFPVLGFALIITVLTSGWFNRLEAKWASKGTGPARTRAALTIIGILIFAIFGPLASVGVLAGSQANKFVSDFRESAPTGVNAFSADYVLERIDETVGPAVKSLGFELNAKKWYTENHEVIEKGAQQAGTSMAKSVGTSALVLVIGLLTAFFLMRDGRNLLDPAQRLLPLTREQIIHICEKVHSTTHAVLVGIVLVSVIQGTLAGIIYAIAGVPNSLMWGVATIIACMVPMLGGPIVYAPIGLLLLTQGKTWQGVLVLGVGFGLISQIDNLLRPFFIGAKTNLHPMAIFFSLLGGVLVWGPLGLFLGPMLLTVVLCVLELLGSKDASNDPSFESA